MVTAPTVVDPSDWNFAYGDKQQMIEKQNAFNQYHHTFSIELAAMVDELNIEFQFVAATRIDITNKSGQVAADRQAVTQAKASVDASKAHIDQREAVIDATADEVSQNAQQVASDKQVVAQDKQAAAASASAASGSAGAALTAKQQAEALYGDLVAVNAAKNASQGAAQTATEQAALADTAREEAQTAAQRAGAGIDAHVGESDPHTQYLLKTGGVINGDIALDKPGTKHLWFREGGVPRGLLYCPASSGTDMIHLRGYLANGSVAAQITLTEGGDIEARTGRFKGNGSGLTDVDADKLNGQSRSVGDDSNTVAGRDSSGDIRARLFRTTYTGLNSNIGVIYTSQNNNGTDYMRPSSPDQVKAALGVTNASNLDSGTVPAARLDRTNSRDNSSTATLLTARGMYDHKRSGDHDGRYYTKGQVDQKVGVSQAPGFGGVGAYGIFRAITGPASNAVRGEVYAGSDLRWCAPDNGSADAPAGAAGSWQLRSHSFSSASRVGLFMRVS